MNTFIANKVFDLIDPRLSLFRQNNRLWLSHDRIDDPRLAIAARVNPHSGAIKRACVRLEFDSSTPGLMGMAFGQLVRWVRDETRVPLAAWQYWTNIPILLAGEDGGKLRRLLREGGYDDSAKCACVICGAIDPPDWCCLHGRIGPCCQYSRCAGGLATYTAKGRVTWKAVR